MSGEAMVNVFIPCAPPTAGYLVFVPKREVTVLDITVEEGLKMVLSAGIVTPPAKPVEEPARIRA